MSDHIFFASAPKHLGSLLAEELTRLGMAGAAETRGGARFSGRIEDGYRACLWSRIANRILLPLAQVSLGGPDEIHDSALEIPWEDHLTPDRTFAIQFDGQLQGVTNPHFAILQVKDAIADRFNRLYGRRPSVDPDDPDLRIHLYGNRDSLSFSLDLSGESLHQRGYRDAGSAAPLKENLAAALLLRAGWPEIAAEGGALLDPMCGSGTLIIEGALIAADIAPGLLRERFGFHGWTQHDEPAWQRLLAEARLRRTAGLKRLGSLRGYDVNPNAIRTSLHHLERAGLAGLAHFERRELSDCHPGREDDEGLVIVNPPYGERLGADEDLTQLYARLGSVLKERFVGWRAAVFTSSPELGKSLGLRATRIHSLYNGPIECRLLSFQIEPRYFVSHLPRPLPPEERSPGAAMFANRLSKNLKALRKWRQRDGIDCLRIYDADLPEYALAIDLYEGERRWVHVQEYAAPPSVDPKRARQRLREALGLIPEVLEVPGEQVFLKVRRQQKGRAQYERLAETGRFHEVSEYGLRFLVNFEDYLDTGLFLDHRDVRRLIGSLSDGKRFLNLFAYTGTATVHAAKGGAASTTTVDLSRTYLEWAGRNLELNGIRGPNHQLIQADCLRWIDSMAGQRRFDLIFLDPPSFSTSKRMHGTLDIQRDHVDIIQATMRLLEPGGRLIFSNNLRRFRIDLEGLAPFEVSDISAQTLPRDFARNPRIHNCWVIQHPESASNRRNGSDDEDRHA
ncbi:bifunctional 23S rRNA (guanine(2069)-N(7))-methyltransferase RlmK/23S rRNA (guanine(2445)-N(2))-methyltransferase RlmL [Allochromatium vinosum]|uniref:Ribosomal RNA large subunit methyltransferase K/L n=1 Tax=Allochromatium vinosum (strain ATCC 17899 / DSM 180 / NBRC 103801 / NCIMB 10441 / D) TaxID=572477 RepID=RLMKL_ALLVD|nr:bifunctional 23S rRNA (guanine(2069)-N(7))-methyltransferase RlmK/23S rRNA (guanine(2445)-N(2))-methyltransferase RlmL [Allochromatium vinosum]Q1W3E0.1 RecName: Full=Ribosomal RNA large subunit methyltransferase K/L; Includes: RecName: Full=23S rRNA m2G2445 methyltransferase; AltName: Full=rRNA (guanine-N(2)-)-methyltransferase RlmL; Includes: RecName: Full=23S rRNA m7G2069 methyltransferase; AltName: Full=rRNA (guanine-N(7)-)-methyltransferase RlmK [Allochromatium vinosum DSM 180]ABE01365.1 m